MSADFLTTLIGKNISTKEVQELLNYCNNDKKITDNKIQYFCTNKGLQIDITNEIVDKIVIYNANTNENNITFNRFSEALFKNLSFDDNRAVTINKLGKPSSIHAQILIYHIGNTEINILFKKTIQKIIFSTRRCVSGDCKDGYGVYQTRNGDRYEGNWKNSIRNGKGTCIYANGDKYEGYWLDDLQDGQGTMIYKNGTASKTGVWERGSFKGEINFRKDLIFDLLGKHKTDETVKMIIENYGKGYKTIQLLHDHQEYRFNNGKLILFFDEYGFVQKIDLVKNGIFDFLPSMMQFLKPGADQKQIEHIFGEPTYKKEVLDNEHKHYIWLYHDSIYHQSFHFNAKRIFQSFHLALDSPNSVLNEINGHCLKGNCKDGYGEMVANVGRYRGGFKAKFFSGKGRLSFTNGGYYNGKFKYNLRHGYGFCQWTDGSSYQGQWRNNVFQGRGVYLYSNKDRYEGDFKYGKRNGYGKMKYADGTIYMGYWKDNLREGRGILQQKNGKRKMWKWANDKIVN
jgi:hypothetical protein